MKKINKNQITIRTALDNFLARKSAEGLSATTLDNYVITLQVFMSDNGFDDLEPISSITDEVILKWKTEMVEAGCRAKASINHYLRDFRVFCNFITDFYGESKKKSL